MLECKQKFALSFSTPTLNEIKQLCIPMKMLVRGTTSAKQVKLCHKKVWYRFPVNTQSVWIKQYPCNISVEHNFVWRKIRYQAFEAISTQFSQMSFTLLILNPIYHWGNRDSKLNAEELYENELIRASSVKLNTSYK